MSTYPPSFDRGVLECDASCNNTLKSSSSSKSRSAIFMTSIFGDSPSNGILRGWTNFRLGAKGEIEIMPGRLFLGDANSPFRGREATSEKKNEVCVGVRGVRGARGVFKAEPNPPGENKPFDEGDCSQARTIQRIMVRSE